MIHHTSIISDKAKIGDNVSIGPYSIIHDGVSVLSDTVIGSFCEIGIPTDLAKKNELIIGSKSIIRSHNIIYTGSKIGKNFKTGHNVTVRENSTIGDYVQLGSRTDLQGDLEVGNHTRLHADVHIGKLSKIGSFCWIFPDVLLTNDPTPPSDYLEGVTIEDFAVIASKSLIMPGVVIGENAVVSAGSLVNINVPAGKLVKGNPAKIICDAKILKMKNDINQQAYPWSKRFFRGYPEDIVNKWSQE